MVRLEDLDYALPEGQIAQHPAVPRDAARLLVVPRDGGALHDAGIRDLPAWLHSGDVLALNETRVRPARLTVRRPTGGRVSLLFVRPEIAGTRGAAETGWLVLARPARNARLGEILSHAGGTLRLAVRAEGEAGERVVEILEGDVARTLETAGEVPLPPYIHRAPERSDRERYQTVFARVEGAVAAPTAGLHFTDELIAALTGRGIGITRIVLHVGPGTFRPITTLDPSEHVMDEEYFEVSDAAATTLAAARAAGGRVVAVGTTVVRALESACDRNGGKLGAARGWTRTFIRPPYLFQGVDALLTNFHLPRTTLLLLVAAFAGAENVQRSYAHAVREGYRFYSYGDAMLIV